jgi:hypothetical protein
MDDQSIDKKIFPEALKLLQTSDSSANFLIVNPSGSFATHFAYRSTTIDLEKIIATYLAGEKTVEQLISEMNYFLVEGLRMGNWIFFKVGSSSFDFANYFADLEYKLDEKDFFNMKRLQDVNYLLSSGFLTAEKHKEMEGYTVHPEAKVIFVSTCKEEEISQLREANKNVEFTYVLLE